MSNRIKFPDHEFATLDIRYKSGRHHHFDTTVADARKRAQSAIDRKGAVWIKVLIPKPDSTKVFRVNVWTPKDKWTSKTISN